MRIILQRIALLIFLIYSFSVCSQSNSIDLLKNSPGKEKYPDANHLVVFDSIFVDVKENGLSYVNRHQLVKVLSARGAMDLSVIKFDYDPLSAAVNIEKVKIYRKDGSIQDLDMAKNLDYPAPAGTILWGAREVMAEIGRLEPGDAVEFWVFRKGFTYALLGDEDEKYIPPMRGHFYDIVEFWSYEPVLSKIYQLKMGREKPLYFQIFNGGIDTAFTSLGKEKVYTFTKSNIDKFKTEPNMVAVSDVAPKLIVTTTKDWEEKSRWFYKVNEDYGSFESSPEIKAKVNEILKGAVSEIDSVSRLTHWCGDEIRYLGLSMGKGEGFTLHKGATIFEDRLGVCKDKAGILITMLRAAGFETYAAMTMAGSRIEDIPADQFNHCVVAVRLSDGKLHLLDPTWVPFTRELWSSLEQQQNYLIGTREGLDLEETAISAPGNHLLKVTGTAALNKDGSLEGVFNVNAEGQSDAAFRVPLTRNFRSEWKRLIEEDLMADYPGMEIRNIEFPDAYDYSKPFSMTVKYKIPDYATINGDKIIFSPFVCGKLLNSKYTHLAVSSNLSKRQYPFRDRCSRSIELSESIILPTAYNPSMNYTNQLSAGNNTTSFNAFISIKDNELSVSAKISLGKRIYSPDDWDAFRAVVLGHKKMAAQRFILVKNPKKQTAHNAPVY